MKKLLSIALVLLVIFSLVGCGSGKREIVKVTLSTEDSEAILAAAGIVLPDVEEVACANTNVDWFAWHDPFHNYSEAEIVNTGFFTFSEKYGCDVNWVETVYDTRYDDLANLLLAGTAPDFYPADSDIFPTYAIKGLFAPVDEYIDYDSPMWQGTAHLAKSHYSLGNGTYLIVTDISSKQVVAYNTRIIDEWGFDDPAQLYYNDEWTWDVFYDMCMEFSDPDEDRYALDGWYQAGALIDSSGSLVVTYNTETKLFESDLDDPRLERAATLCADLRKNDCVYPNWERNYVVRDNVEGGGIGTGLCLFYIVGTWGFTGPVEEISQVWGDVTQNEVMFAPLPRDPNGDGNYYCQANPDGYCLIKGGDNHEAVALLAACERFKVLDPTVIDIDEKQLRDIYLWTDEMLDMYDVIHDAANSPYVVVEYGDGLGVDLEAASGNIKKIGRRSSPKSFAQTKEQYGEQILYYVDVLNEEVKAFIAENQ